MKTNENTGQVIPDFHIPGRHVQLTDKPKNFLVFKASEANIQHLETAYSKLQSLL